MKYREYGKEKTETIILLHGGGLSWWNYREEALLLANDYHVILPVLDGHAESDRGFTSIEDNASEIISFIDKHFNGSLLLIGGLSLGAQVLLEMLSQREDICKYALVESAAVIPDKLTNVLIKPAFGSSYGLIKNRSFAKLQFDSLHMKADLFEDYYRDTCAISKKDMISFMEANTSYTLKDSLGNTRAKVHICYGSKETSRIKRSAVKINEIIPHSELHLLNGYYHGVLSLNHPQEYVNAIKEIII
ncbi:MAG: alpha/beta hydrolase [Erysipelotrichaceae bacterium]|nr:alpha/beta hydrolase [Erysipelotrichaceae bacterium]